MKKSFANQCLKLSDAATPGPWTVDFKDDDWYGIESDKEPHDWIMHADDSGINRPKKDDAEFIAAAREMVPELCRRLKRACEFLRYIDGTTKAIKFADELEALPKIEKIS